MQWDCVGATGVVEVGDAVGLGGTGLVVVMGGAVMVGSDPVAGCVPPGVVVVVVVVESQQPQNLPGVSQFVLVDGGESLSLLVDDVVVVITGVLLVVVVILSLHPNQPGVLHVDVEDVLVLVVVVGPPVVVVSRQPHQPGVLHVSVRVLVFVLFDVWDVVVDSVPLLSYIFQLAQSRHSGVNLHSATSSYLRMTSLITEWILCVPMPTRHPLSATTS